jgi:hypothetical protein
MKVQLATRLDPQLRQRLRIYAAVTGRTVEEVAGADRIWWIGGTAAVCFALAVAAGLWLER